MTPFNIISKLLGPYLFSSTARETLGDKMELYFHDFSFVPLFVQENYLRTTPAKVQNMANGPERTMKQLELMDRAAMSLSDGDLVDAMIHGNDQHWSLMPLHAALSTVRPASFIYGQGAHYGGPNGVTFPQWLGQNSKQTKLRRALGDIQVRMRLRVTGDKQEIRQTYIPALYHHLVKPLTTKGADAIPGVIEAMDEYFLSKEEWDTIVELGVDEFKEDVIMKKIPSATKSALTRKYNSTDHPIAFHQAEFGKPTKKIGATHGPAPDLEDAFDLDDDVEEEEPEVKANEGISGDSLIKEKGKAKATTTKSKAKK